MRELADQGVLHPLLANIADHEHVYGHQETAIRSIIAGQNTLVRRHGLWQNRMLPLSDYQQGAGTPGRRSGRGISAVIIYPMNALAEDQLGRLRELLCGVGISFGLYVGKTPQRATMSPDSACRRARPEPTTPRKCELRPRTAGRGPSAGGVRVARRDAGSGQAPRILLTNVKQLELLLTATGHRNVRRSALISW